jgi:glycosyltransferase involved in cell wall biosynthesis
MDSTHVLSIVIPVFNEEQTIGQVLTLLTNLPCTTQIIVVDDASTDDTAAVVSAHEHAHLLTMVQHPQNRGKGAAIRSALPLVIGTVVVIQDADLEYNPTELLTLLTCIEAGADVVYGTRFGVHRPLGMLATHYAGNRVLTAIFNLLYGTHLSDLETCYKMFRVGALRHIGIDNDRFDIDPELTAKCIRSGYQIVEVPVHYLGRPYRAGKKIRPRDAFAAVRTMWRYRKYRPT